MILIKRLQEIYLFSAAAVYIFKYQILNVKPLKLSEFPINKEPENISFELLAPSGLFVVFFLINKSSLKTLPIPYQLSRSIFLM